MIRRRLSQIRIYSLLGVALVLGSCERIFNSSGPDTTGGTWLIPVGEVQDVLGKDGIPAISNPQFASVENASYMSDQDLVVGVKVGDEMRAYPHFILDWHEIVNDEMGDREYALTYCPLTGSGISWNRVLDGTSTTFGVSGRLYNTNLIPYDRATGSHWSQMKLLCVQGENIGTEIEIFPVVETTWKTWREMYPATRVMTTATGYGRNYGLYPYGNYRTNTSLLFPVSETDSRLHPKARVAGLIVDGAVKVYQLSSFVDSVGVINDVFSDMPIVIAGSAQDNFMTIFHRELADGTVLTLTPLQQSKPAVMIDNEGTTWDVFGYGLSGPRAGEQLPATRSFIAYWLAWAAFYPGVEIYSSLVN